MLDLCRFFSKNACLIFENGTPFSGLSDSSPMAFLGEVPNNPKIIGVKCFNTSKIGTYTSGGFYHFSRCVSQKNQHFQVKMLTGI